MEGSDTCQMTIVLREQFIATYLQLIRQRFLAVRNSPPNGDILTAMMRFIWPYCQDRGVTRQLDQKKVAVSRIPQSDKLPYYILHKPAITDDSVNPFDICLG
jgi:hypothetical protein